MWAFLKLYNAEQFLNRPKNAFIDSDYDEDDNDDREEIEEIFNSYFPEQNGVENGSLDSCGIEDEGDDDYDSDDHHPTILDLQKMGVKNTREILKSKIDFKTDK